MAISYLLDSWRNRPTIFILSDSKFIMDLLNRSSFSVEFEHLIAHVLMLKDAYSPSHQAIRFCWVPGHSGLIGNEVADEMANVGSGSARALPLIIPSGDVRFEYDVSLDTSPP